MALSKNIAEWLARIVSDLLGLLTLDAAVLLKLPLHTFAEISKACCSSTRPYNPSPENAAEKIINCKPACIAQWRLAHSSGHPAFGTHSCIVPALAPERRNSDMRPNKKSKRELCHDGSAGPFTF